MKSKTAIEIETKTCLPNDVKVVMKKYRPGLELLICKYKFKDYDIKFDIDMTQNDPYITSSVRLSPLVNINIFFDEEPYVDIEPFIGSASERKEYLKAVNDAFELCEVSSVITEDVKETYKISKTLMS